MLKEEREGLASRRIPTYIRNPSLQIVSLISINNLTLEGDPEVSERSNKRKGFLLLSMLPL
jgi:hypothetical protein